MLVSSRARPLSVAQTKISDRRFPSYGTHLLVQMKHKYNDSEDEQRSDDGDSDPGYPLSWPQVELLPPHIALDWGDDYDLRIRNDAFHIDVVLIGMLGRADEEVLDVVVSSAQTKVGIRGQKRLVSCLRELGNCDDEVRWFLVNMNE